MPYIIAVHDPIDSDQSKRADADGVLRYTADNSEVFPGATGVRASKSRTATVATLEEARSLAEDAVLNTDGGADATDQRDDARTLPECGGTIELPDGTTIDVWPTVSVEEQRPWITESSAGVPEISNDAIKALQDLAQRNPFVGIGVGLEILNASMNVLATQDQPKVAMFAQQERADLTGCIDAFLLNKLDPAFRERLIAVRGKLALEEDHGPLVSGDQTQ